LQLEEKENVGTVKRKLNQHGKRVHTVKQFKIKKNIENLSNNLKFKLKIKKFKALKKVL